MTEPDELTFQEKAVLLSLNDRKGNFVLNVGLMLAAAALSEMLWEGRLQFQAGKASMWQVNKSPDLKVLDPSRPGDELMDGILNRLVALDAPES